MTANMEELSIVNIYVPSGTARKPKREAFFNGELAYLVRHANGPILLGGESNCTTDPMDSTGQVQPITALANLLNGLGLHDIWKQNPSHQAYTHYLASGASRIDRMYLSRNIMGNEG
jgi:exonuclease III